MSPCQRIKLTFLPVRGTLAICGIIAGLAWGGCAQNAPQKPAPSVFDEPAPQVEPSPGDRSTLNLPQGETLLDFAVSPAGPEVTVLTHPAGGGAHVLLWKIGSAEAATIWQSDGSFAPRALAWHPAKRSLFMLGPSGAEFIIVRLDGNTAGWNPVTLFHTKRPIRRLIVGPRPFELDPAHAFYRLFFAVPGANGTAVIASVTEAGERYYEVTRTKDSPAPQPLAKDEEPPKPFEAQAALPEAFHSAGHIMIWVDGKQCFEAVHYGRDNWEKSTPLRGGQICGGSLETTPNGLGLLHWRKGVPGVQLFLSGQETATPLAPELNFTSVPLSTADGRGLVGSTYEGAALQMVYVPVEMPLANVTNAWMFLESARDRTLFGDHGGLFRSLGEDQQLYQLYDSELYYCEAYDSATPTRPYLVTTDIFWENFAAAYEGLFVLLERRQAIPEFFQFVHAAAAALASSPSAWAGVFRALDQVTSKPQPDDPEAVRIMGSAGMGRSSVLGADFNYAELKPRGHYTGSDQEQRYFRAFRYLSSVATEFPQQLPAAQLSSLPPAAQEHARAWIRSYLPFIAPSRAPSVWTGGPASIPTYARHPTSLPAPFPLAWGFDNETLLSTVYHADWPADEQIKGPSGERLLPSGLDVAAALGSSLARTLLEPDIRQYPALAKTLDGLKARASVAAAQPPGNLYDRWIEALGASWAESAGIPGETRRELWDTKRLQTGLSSWATLRHATVLVNERTAAECGEGGFEAIELSPPRGYVEPAPDVFEASAGLFDAAAKFVQNSTGLAAGKAPSESGEAKPEALRQGVLRRLAEAAANARRFGAIARKELDGQPLSADDYDEILHVGRAAEYDFLIFKSLANPDFALSNPDPMPKIADVAGGANGIPYLHAAVGAPLEWDQVVPYFGRREIVKGSAYSYYEFSSPAPLSDADWRARLRNEPRPAWVTPFISNQNLSCPAKDPY
jgi:hypothetical protein